jgi:hypothetical protein
MYPRKTMSVVSVEGKSLVHFRGKVYVPLSLREKAMRHYRDQYRGSSSLGGGRAGNDDDDATTARAKLAEDCTWPGQERDMFDFVRNQS